MFWVEGGSNESILMWKNPLAPSLQTAVEKWWAIPNSCHLSIPQHGLRKETSSWDHCSPWGLVPTISTTELQERGQFPRMTTHRGQWRRNALERWLERRQKDGGTQSRGHVQQGPLVVLWVWPEDPRLGPCAFEWNWGYYPRQLISPPPGSKHSLLNARPPVLTG